MSGSITKVAPFVLHIAEKDPALYDALNQLDNRVTGSERLFIGYFTSGVYCGVNKFPDRYVSKLDGRAYKQTEVQYDWTLYSVGNYPTTSFVQGQQKAPQLGTASGLAVPNNIDDSNGLVSTNGILKVYAICQRGYTNTSN